MSMIDTTGATSNVVPFRRPAARVPSVSASRHDQRGFMDAVYTAGSLPVAADNRETKLAASRLQVFGFVDIEEIQADGTARRLRPSEAMRASADRPWRVSKPSYATGYGVSVPSSDAFLFEPIPWRA